MHGYEIHQHLSEATGLGLVWQVKQSQLYALLGKLEDKGYLTTTLEPQDTRPPRKIFQLTERGQEAFLNWVRSPVQHGRKLRLEFLAKLYFARHETPQILADLISNQRQACQRWLVEQQAEAGRSQGGNRFDQLVHLFRKGQIEAMIDWLDACENAFSTNAEELPTQPAVNDA
jgi:DNA-binding PadR family transcriptional regulator